MSRPDLRSFSRGVAEHESRRVRRGDTLADLLLALALGIVLGLLLVRCFMPCHGGALWC